MLQTTKRVEKPNPNQKDFSLLSSTIKWSRLKEHWKSFYHHKKKRKLVTKVAIVHVSHGLSPLASTSPSKRCTQSHTLTDDRDMSHSGLGGPHNTDRVTQRSLHVRGVACNASLQAWNLHITDSLGQWCRILMLLTPVKCDFDRKGSERDQRPGFAFWWISAVDIGDNLEEDHMLGWGLKSPTHVVLMCGHGHVDRD